MTSPFRHCEAPTAEAISLPFCHCEAQSAEAISEVGEENNKEGLAPLLDSSL